ncbi:hypothetical protein [Saccharothrix sp. ALI-22-I]|uniref:hypothetical protein n=1 Tax=Saccharothrix sp. ALI-22-I TaxID=1933778 RepID=UPI00117BCAF1|nr:hypothetical protein [Saccharothrix sp. ALI-22-I]
MSAGTGFQSGEVTGINDSSISVTSTDGYTKTYTIDGDIVSRLTDIAQGDTVTVVSEDGTAQSITEAGAMPGSQPPTQ